MQSFLLHLEYENNNAFNFTFISGHIYDSASKVRLRTATIVLKNKANKYGVTSDSTGFFQLKLPIEYECKNFWIIATYIGYAPDTLYIENKKNKILFNKDLNVYLHPAQPSNKVIYID